MFVAFINSVKEDLIPWPTIYGGVTLQEIILAVLSTIIQACVHGYVHVYSVLVDVLYILA